VLLSNPERGPAGTDEEKLAKFREVRDRIEQKIKEWLEQQGAG
jgi:hypothetical protein